MSEKKEDTKEKSNNKVKTNEQIKEIVTYWWAQHIHDSPISRNTDIYNYFCEIKKILIDELTK